MLQLAYLMVLQNLFSKNCSICSKRGDNFKRKDCIKEIKNQDLQSKLANYFCKTIEIGDIICKKHLHKMNGDERFIYLQENIDENNNISIVDHIYHDDSPVNERNFIEETFNDSTLTTTKPISNMKVEVNIPRVQSSHVNCFVCKKPSGNIFFITFKLYKYRYKLNC